MARFGGEKFDSVMLAVGSVELWRTIRNADEVHSLGSTTQYDDGRPIDMDLALAANDGDVEKMRELVDGGANVNFRTKSDGMAPIHYAAFEGQQAAVKALAELGADVTLRDDGGNSARDVQQQNSKHRMVRLLARLEQEQSERKRAAMVAAAAAAAAGTTTTSDACVGCGARRCGVACKLCSSCHSVRYCSIACQRSHWPTHKASCKASSKANANSGSSSGGGSTRSAPATGSNSGTKAAVVAMDLHRAAAAGQTATVRRLVAEGTSVHAVVDDETPLHKAAEKGHTHTARALLQLGADKEAGGRAGARPLHVAAKRGQLEMVKVLLAEGAHVDGRSDDGVTPLTLCVAADEQHAGHLAVARLLVLEAGADVEATTVATAGGFRPLHLAASVGAECMVRVLVGELGANKEACAFAQRTRPLHLAAGGGHPGTIRALVELGADLEATSDGGETPLQHAAMANMVPAVKTLVALGAKLDARDSRGMTALQRKQRVDRVHADDQDMLDALTELEDAARQKAAASERLRREHERADRAAAALLQQEEEQLEEKQKTNNKGSRKERHRQRKLEQASEMLDVAMAVMAESGVSESTVRTMQEALDEAGKYKDRCEALTARMQLVEAALEKARAAEAAAAEAAEKEAGTAAEAAAVAQLEQERADATVGAEEEEEEEVVVWTCEVCTYINEDPLIHMCEMCGVLKG